jgi:Cd(II)/Pb(II)-responsive transcriptional regulator
MRIGELAQRGGCDVETVRFYEREGLLERPEREVNGYRSYAEAHVVQLNFIRHCRSLGMGLPDVRTLRNFQHQPDASCDGIDQLIEAQIQRIQERVGALQLLERQLHTLRDTCRTRQRSSDCGILQNLNRAAEGEECSCHPVGSGSAPATRSGRRRRT